MSTDTFFCEPCNKVLLLHNELRHVNSKGHRTKQEKYENKKQIIRQEQKCQDKFECFICAEEYSHIPITNIKSCKSCKQSWCLECHKKIYTCPYCRFKIYGKKIQEKNITSFEEMIHVLIVEPYQNLIRENN